MKENFKRYGVIHTLDDIYGELKNDILDRQSLREQVPNQRFTRNAVGLYNILDDVAGFGNKEVFMAYYPHLYEVSQAIKNEYGYTHLEYRSLMVVKLLAGKEIAEHIDEAGIYKYAHRVHIPIITNEGCIFTIDGEEGRMAAGEIVEINNTVPHSVVNGDMDRVHLIVDIIGIKCEFDDKALSTAVPKQFYYEED